MLIHASFPIRLKLTELTLTVLSMSRDNPSDPHRKSRRRHHKGSRGHRALPERGWVQLLSLRILHEGPIHGYQLITEMETRGFVESGRFETGSIYTILNRMEKHELLTSKKMKGDSGRVRRVYNITEEGEKTLVKGLRSIIQWKKVTEELVEYYEEQFNDYETTPDMKHEDNHPNKKKLM